MKYEIPMYEKLEYKGRNMIQLAVDWIKMSNDDFFRVYGINFNPHRFPGLYEMARNIVYPDGGRYAT